MEAFANIIQQLLDRGQPFPTEVSEIIAKNDKSAMEGIRSLLIKEDSLLVSSKIEFIAKYPISFEWYLDNVQKNHVLNESDTNYFQFDIPEHLQDKYFAIFAPVPIIFIVDSSYEDNAFIARKYGFNVYVDIFQILFGNDMDNSYDCMGIEESEQTFHPFRELNSLTSIQIAAEQIPVINEYLTAAMNKLNEPRLRMHRISNSGVLAAHISTLGSDDHASNKLPEIFYSRTCQILKILNPKNDDYIRINGLVIYDVNVTKVIKKYGIMQVKTIIMPGGQMATIIKMSYDNLTKMVHIKEKYEYHIHINNEIHVTTNLKKWIREQYDRVSKIRTDILDIIKTKNFYEEDMKLKSIIQYFLVEFLKYNSKKLTIERGIPDCGSTVQYIVDDKIKFIVNCSLHGGMTNITIE